MDKYQRFYAAQAVREQVEGQAMARAYVDMGFKLEQAWRCFVLTPYAKPMWGPYMMHLAAVIRLPGEFNRDWPE